MWIWTITDCRSDDEKNNKTNRNRRPSVVKLTSNWHPVLHVQFPPSVCLCGARCLCKLGGERQSVWTSAWLFATDNCILQRLSVRSQETDHPQCVSSLPAGANRTSRDRRTNTNIHRPTDKLTHKSGTWPPGAVAPPPKKNCAFPLKNSNKNHFSSYHFTICIVTYEAAPSKKLFSVAQKIPWPCPTKTCGWLRTWHVKPMSLIFIWKTTQYLVSAWN